MNKSGIILLITLSCFTLLIKSANLKNEQSGTPINCEVTIPAHTTPTSSSLSSTILAIIANANGTSSGTNDLNLSGNRGTALEDNSSATALNLNAASLSGLFSGKSGLFLDGTGRASTGTTGGSALLITPDRTNTKHTESGAAILELFGGSGRTATLSTGNTSLDSIFGRASAATGGATTLDINGRGTGASASTGSGSLDLNHNGASGTTDTSAANLLSINRGTGSSNTSSTGGLNINTPGANGRTSTNSTGGVIISGNGTGSTTSTGSSSVNIGSHW